jgi:hypothetical protein
VVRELVRRLRERLDAEAETSGSAERR